MAESEKAREGGAAGEGAVAKPKKSSQSKTGQSARKAPRKRASRKSKQLPPFNVVLLDDNHHTVDYVVEMLRKLFGHPEERGIQLAQEVDTEGRVIVLTTHKELAELKRDQIHSFGADWRIEICAGSMNAIIEPAQPK